MFSLWISLNTLCLSMWLAGSWGTTGSSFAGKCRGTVNCWVGAARATATFEAWEPGTTAAGGVFKYRDVTPTGMVRVFTLRVTRVSVTGDDGVFVGWVETSNIPGWQGRWVKVWVRDRGSPGRLGDRISFRFHTTSQGAWLLTPLVYFPVTGGDLAVDG